MHCDRVYLFYTGESILEALQGRPTFLFYSNENISRTSISSCMPFGTFYAIIFPRGTSNASVLSFYTRTHTSLFLKMGTVYTHNDHVH